MAHQSVQHVRVVRRGAIGAKVRACKRRHAEAELQVLRYLSAASGTWACRPEADYDEVSASAHRSRVTDANLVRLKPDPTDKGKALVRLKPDPTYKSVTYFAEAAGSANTLAAAR